MVHTGVGNKSITITSVIIRGMTTYCIRSVAAEHREIDSNSLVDEMWLFTCCQLQTLAHY